MKSYEQGRGFGEAGHKRGAVGPKIREELFLKL